MYGRVGVGFLAEKDGAVGRSFNLQGMGSRGGRHEEGDYLEFMTRYNLPIADSSALNTQVYVQTRLAMFSSSGTFIGFNATNSLNDLAILLPEAFVEAKNVWVKDLSFWAGARFYRGDDIHIADYYYFNDLSGQGGGLQYKKSKLAILLATNPDSTQSIPSYVYNNLVDGSVRPGLRQRFILALQQEFSMATGGNLHLLAEFHKMSKAKKSESGENTFPANDGFAAGIKWQKPLQQDRYKSSVLNLSIRYGTGIANGSDGANSRSWLTYGAFQQQDSSFSGASTVNTANEIILQLDPNWFLQAYGIAVWSKGAAETEGKALNAIGDSVFNRKSSVALGARSSWFVAPRLMILNEISYQQRQNGANPTAAVWKFTIGPTLVPRGGKGIYKRPQLRLIYTLAAYNQYARSSLASPYLQAIGSEQFAHYFGLKSEWWF